MARKTFLQTPGAKHIENKGQTSNAVEGVMQEGGDGRYINKQKEYAIDLIEEYEGKNHFINIINIYTYIIVVQEVL